MTLEMDRLTRATFPHARPRRPRTEATRAVADPGILALLLFGLPHAKAWLGSEAWAVDIVAPSDMLDGRVQAIRAGLDAAGLFDTAILSCAARYASAFCGPFREAADSAPQFGDRRGYQMDPGSGREALREVALDLAEGADNRFSASWLGTRTLRRRKITGLRVHLGRDRCRLAGWSLVIDSSKSQQSRALRLGHTG